ncbi:hypothetical protein C0995_012402 [Termitomyces sp. Mi166|nr:hypothetical protein C0995_012402 [Termitomyces sp. Mi166\
MSQRLPPSASSYGAAFQPLPAAGPNSDSYYIGIISTTAKENSSDPFSVSYKAFSPFFSIDQMTGSFDSPLPEATSTIPITSSAFSRSTTHLSTITLDHLCFVADKAYNNIETVDVNAGSDYKCGVNSGELGSFSDVIEWCFGPRTTDTSLNGGGSPTLAASIPV